MDEHEAHSESSILARVPWKTVAYGVLFYVVMLRRPGAARVEVPDHAFGLAYADFLRRGFDAGTDYIFTYGPLGHFVFPYYTPELFWVDWAVCCVLGLLVAIPLALFAASMPSRTLEVLFILYATTAMHARLEFPILGAALAGAMLVLRKEKVVAPCLIVFGAGLAFFALSKFTLFILLGGVTAYTALVAWRRSRLTESVVLLASFAIFVCVFWFSAGQSVSNVIPFILNSLEISTAYDGGMSLDTETSVVAIALLAVALAGLTAAFAIRREQDAMSQGFHVILVLALLTITWKMGLVRHETLPGPPLIAFALIPLVYVREDRLALPTLLASACIVVTFAQIANAKPQGYLRILGSGYSAARFAPQFTFAPGMYRARMESLRTERYEAAQLSQISEAIGDATVDVFPPLQYVAFANRWNYRPRPVFQGYQACTPELLRLNGATYLGGAATPAPEFVVFSLRPIDNRYPALEDSAALQALLTHYESGIEEKGFVLLKRRSDARGTTAAPLVIADAKFGETVELHDLDSWLLATFDIQLNLRGRAAAMLEGSPAATIRVTLNDGSSKVHRLPPVMATEPFVLSPYLEGQSAVFGYRGGDSPRAVVSFQIIDEAGYFEANYAYSLSNWELGDD